MLALKNRAVSGWKGVAGQHKGPALLKGNAARRPLKSF